MSDHPLPDPNIPIVVFDLDSTLARSVWPVRNTVGEPIPEGIALLIHYANLGYRIEIQTARPRMDGPTIWGWIEEHGLPVDAVHCEKPFAGLYIDDRAYCPEYTKELPRFSPPVNDEWDDDEITRMGPT